MKTDGRAEKPVARTLAGERARAYGIASAALGFGLLVAALTFGAALGYSNVRRLTENQRELRVLLADMQGEQESLLARRASEAEARLETTLQSILLTAVVGIVLVAIVFTLIRRSAVQRQRAAEVLEAQREQLRVTLASIGDAVLATDDQGCITFLNPVGEAVTGWTQDEAAGRPLQEVFRVVNEHTREPVENPAERALREGVIVGLANHTVLVRKDGTERPIDDSAAPILGGHGQVVGCVLVFRDVTRQRSLEQQLSERLTSARLLASIVESSGDAILSISLDGIVQTWNAAAQGLYGYSALEAVGRHVSFIIPPNRADEAQQILAHLRHGERVEHFETERLRSDGQLVPVSLTISPVLDEAGDVIGASKTARDISDRRQAEERIYGLLADLKAADRRKDEFLATLAHELRGPLAPLRNMLEIMKRAGDDRDLVQQGRDTMERQLGQLVRLVDDLIDVSRITRDKLELRRETVELASIIHHSVEACRPLAEAAHHQVSVNLPAEPVYLDADPVRLAQVFGNLVNNACKYTEPGGGISITAERTPGGVTVRVKDTGVGIPPDRLDRIFEMFAQVDGTLGRSQGGLGIGLTLVERLVAMHGGSVEAISDGPGRGSEFVVRLPAQAEKPVAPTGQAAARKPVPRRRVLVVDDNPDAADSLATLLKITGHEAHTAHDGEEAVQAAEKLRPELILLDIGLPKLSGYEVCRRIRAQPWGRKMVIVALTGWGQDDDRRKSFDAGFDAHLVKPVDFEALRRLLAEGSPTPS